MIEELDSWDVAKGTLAVHAVQVFPEFAPGVLREQVKLVGRRRCPYDRGCHVRSGAERPLVVRPRFALSTLLLTTGILPFCRRFVLLCGELAKLSLVVRVATFGAELAFSFEVELAYPQRRQHTGTLTAAHCWR